MTNENHEVVVVGGGPGGYVAAIRVAQLGGKVTVIEKEALGGTCLNVGCIPTKVLLHAADLLTEAESAHLFGVKLSVKGVEWDKVLEKKNGVSKQLVNGINGLMKANKINVINGTASFTSSKTLSITKADGTTETINAEKIILATGSTPAMPPIPGVKENENCIDSTGALRLTEIPESLLIIGGGVIGVEFASIYSRFGTKVTIIESLPEILPQMEGSLTKILKKNLEKTGVDIHTNTKVQSVEKASIGALVNVETNGKKQSFQANKVLIAVGRKANTESLNLARAGVKSDGGNIVVNEKLATNVNHIFAIGDCLGQVMLAHVASAQGEIAAENAMGQTVSYNGQTVPSCVYTNPEFASVGLTEERAKAEGLDYITGSFPLQANGKSLIMNEGEGMIKVILGKEFKEVLGVHIIGPRATELIAECALAIGMEATSEDIIATIHAHPTLAEAFRESVLAAEGIAIHSINE